MTIKCSKIQSNRYGNGNSMQFSLSHFLSLTLFRAKVHTLSHQLTHRVKETLPIVERTQMCSLLFSLTLFASENICYDDIEGIQSYTIRTFRSFICLNVLRRQYEQFSSCLVFSSIFAFQAFDVEKPENEWKIMWQNSPKVSISWFPFTVVPWHTNIFTQHSHSASTSSSFTEI